MSQIVPIPAPKYDGHSRHACEESSRCHWHRTEPGSYEDTDVAGHPREAELSDLNPPLAPWEEK